MTDIDLEEKPATWFEMEGGGRLQIRIPSIDTWKQIRRQTVHKKVEFKKVEGTAGRFEHEEIDEDLQNELFWDAVIVSFENFTNKGILIPCTKENKVRMMMNDKFAKFFRESFKTLTDYEEKQTGALEKNS